MSISKGFRFPPSPFAEEKEALGNRFEAVPDYRFIDPPKEWRRAALLSKFKRKLSRKDREYIASTGRETPAWELAEDYGVSITYVYRLRATRREELAKKNGRVA